MAVVVLGVVDRQVGKTGVGVAELKVGETGNLHSGGHSRVADHRTIPSLTNY